eukprot:13117149-Ditylum_brightwellii.AAC.1
MGVTIVNSMIENLRNHRVEKILNATNNLNILAPPDSQQLLTHWKIVTHYTNLERLIHLATPLYYVTDSGAYDGIGYYGADIATDAMILVEGNGQVLGSKHLMESLRAETYMGDSTFYFH